MAMIAFGQGGVPVIGIAETVVSDSWDIACYLEAHYPERPSLFGGAVGQAHARLINAWADSAVLGSVARLVVGDIVKVIDPKDRDYFRATREQRFDATLEAVQADGRANRTVAGSVKVFDSQAAEAVRSLAGAAPSYADHIPGSARCKPGRAASAVRDAGGGRSGAGVAAAGARSVRRPGRSAACVMRA